LPSYYADLHIHIGRTGAGRPVKITASPRLTLEAILEEAWRRKGLQIIGIIDCASPGVLADLDGLVGRELLREQSGGGLLYRSQLLLIPGCELEVKMGRGRGHLLSYFPRLENVKGFSQALDPYVTNRELSTQQIALTADQLLELTLEHQGVLIPAHVFTPHRSLLGSCVDELREAFPAGKDYLLGIELGLSADSFMADRISQLASLAFLTSSDAHSLPRIGREHTQFKLQELAFGPLIQALKGQGGNAIVANYGLDPRLGKYYHSCCGRCGSLQGHKTCEKCGGTMSPGVAQRIDQLGGDYRPPPGRPPYHHQIPLAFIPGCGPKTITKLIEAFGSEMAVLHQVPWEDLRPCVGETIADRILANRQGTMEIQGGGGGTYGRIKA
jgi:uncharacterized protein (TIGR00375 family)